MYVFTLNTKDDKMKTIIHSATKRGIANHGWLKSAHSFSFANFYDPTKMGFGLLRVLNDDFVEGGMGFGTHPHDNMEIISIALEGELEHQDSMGNKAVIKPGEVQIMSAGTGIKHSEKNKSSKQPVKFLQIWVMPKKRNIAPRYDQQFFDPKERLNALQTVVSPDNTVEKGVKINQDAWFSLSDLESGKSVSYEIKKKGNGVYLFVLEGQIEIAGKKLGKRDAIGISESESFEIMSFKNSNVLLMEVPMN
jgi:redox-sensitive bicupin YhaK (pirin superfamily)